MKSVSFEKLVAPFVPGAGRKLDSKPGFAGFDPSTVRQANAAGTTSTLWYRSQHNLVAFCCVGLVATIFDCLSKDMGSIPIRSATSW